MSFRIPNYSSSFSLALPAMSRYHAGRVNSTCTGRCRNMRRIIFGLALAATVNTASAQDPATPPTSLMPAFTGNKAGGPAALPGTIAPAPGVTLKPVFQMPALQQPKPQSGWELRPEHGEWFIEIKSYAQIESG